MTKTKIYVSWNEFNEMTLELAEQIKKSKIKFSGIYGIPRGGLPLAVYLSHNLELPLIFEGKPTLDHLIVDDISDKGNTLNNFQDYTIACLYSTPWTKNTPNWYVRLKQDENQWIIFPWEKDDRTEKNNTI